MPANEFSSGERALSRLINDAHLAPADRMAETIAAAAAELGARDTSVLIVDHQQTQLVDLAHGEKPLPLEGSVAGRVFRHGTVERVGVEGGERLWVPMLDGIERVGVLGLTVDAVDDALPGRARRLASLSAELLLTKSLYSDTLHRAARRREMSLAAEMQWELVPPLSVGTDRITLTAMLEPAYEVGGDVFDYSVEDRLVQLGIFDAMGHGLSASLCSALALGAYRNARRGGAALERTAEAIDEALWQQFAGDRFATAVLAEIDTDSGRLRWVTAGHPRPLLLRGGRVVKELTGVPAVPLGLGLAKGFTVNEELLEPGDRLLLYTDGVVERRTDDGAEAFGVERLAAFLVEADAAGEDLPETMRRLSRMLLELHGGDLRDDASQMLVEWRGGAAEKIHRRFSAGSDA